jgi:DNA-binding MltR family transcriptional regulator
MGWPEIGSAMSKKAKRRTLRDLSSSQVEVENWPEVFEEVHHTSDRTAAIVLASWVERFLEQVIIDTLPKHDDETVGKLLRPEGALNSFFAKIHLGFALGLYDGTTVDNLEAIRKIRNAFAHTAIAIHFETEEIIEEIRKLHVTTRPTPEPLMQFSEYRRKFELACLRFVTRTE